MTETGAGTQARSVLKITDLVAGYGGGDVLRGVSLDVTEGGITCVVGPNGAGKSTLMAAISGLLRPRLGSIELDGRNLAGMSPRQVLRLGVVQVQQNHSSFRDMTVAFWPVRQVSEWGSKKRLQRLACRRLRPAQPRFRGSCLPCRSWIPFAQRHLR